MSTCLDFALVCVELQNVTKWHLQKEQVNTGLMNSLILLPVLMTHKMKIL